MIEPKFKDVGRTVIFRGKKRGILKGYSKQDALVEYPPHDYVTLVRLSDLEFDDVQTSPTT